MFCKPLVGGSNPSAGSNAKMKLNDKQITGVGCLAEAALLIVGLT